MARTYSLAAPPRQRTPSLARAFALAAPAVLAACGTSVGPTDATVDENSADVALGSDGALPTDAGATDASDALAAADGTPPPGDGAALPDGRVVHGPFATRVVSVDIGPNGGFGRNNLPDIVLGPPVGGGIDMGSTDVLSLGRGGRVCVEFGDGAIVDGPGQDFTVFENAFEQSGTAIVFAELGEVSVSDDGVSYQTFACTRTGPPYTGCAGWNPVFSSPTNGISPLDPRYSGGDPFDLATVGLARARFVCIHDLETVNAGAPTAGFDLDGVAAVHFAPNP